MLVMRDETEWRARDRRGGDRRRNRRYTFRDQRTGFDRREPRECQAGALQNTLAGLREQPRTLWWLLAAVNVLNIADYVLTLNALSHGFAEANPVMGLLFDMNPALAGIFKTLAVLLASLLAWQLKRYRKALLVAIGMLVVFAGVFAWHLCGAMLML
jgi:hypothetical protein